MLFALMLLFKIILFLNITQVKYNLLLIFMISGLVIIFIYSNIYLSRRKYKNRLGLGIYIFISLILFADILHFTYFNTLLSVRMLGQLNQVIDVGDSLRTLFLFKNLLMVLDIPLVTYYTYKKDKKKKDLIFLKEEDIDSKIRWGVVVFIGSILLGTFIYIGSSGRLDSVINQEVFSFHINDIRMMIKGNETSSATEIIIDDEILDDLKDRSRLKEGKYTGMGKGKNLIVIQVESLQNFVINREYRGEEITPVLNSLIEEQGSLYFDNYFQLIGRGNSSDAEFVSHNSLYPSMDEPSYTAYEKKTFNGLPWLLKEQGYTNWVFHGYKPEFWNREKAYVNQGFDRFISEADYEIREEEIAFGISDGDFYDQSIDYIKELNEVDDNPFYAFLISLSSHNPFTMPEQYMELEIEDRYEGSLLGNYINSIRYADRVLGEFIQGLKDEGLYDDTLIAIYGDHFAINSSHKEDQKIMTDFLGYEYRMDEMMKIPLIIKVPGGEMNETISRVGSQMDFYPTMMNIMGYENENGLVFGRDLVNYEGDHIIAPQTYMLKGSFIDEDTVFIMSRDGVFEHSTAYDIKTREGIDIETCRGRSEKAIREINIGDCVMEKDIFKGLVDRE